MKQIKNLFLLVLLFSINTTNAQCDQDIMAWDIHVGMPGYLKKSNAINYPGIGVGKAYLAVEHKVGVATGIFVNPMKTQEVFYNNEGKYYNNVNSLNISIYAEGLLKLYYVPYVSSMHLVGGATLDFYKKLALHSGINIRFPAGYKAFYIQGIYRSDQTVFLKLGLYFQ